VKTERPYKRPLYYFYVPVDDGRSNILSFLSLFNCFVDENFISQVNRSREIGRFNAISYVRSDYVLPIAFTTVIRCKLRASCNSDRKT